jgi:hypothetical protein
MQTTTKRRKERTFDLRKPLDMIRYIVTYPFSFPGCYEHIAITSDGGLLCSNCVRDNYREIFYDTKHKICLQWEVTAITIDAELEECYCSHCNKPIGYYEEEE